MKRQDFLILAALITIIPILIAVVSATLTGCASLVGDRPPSQVAGEIIEDIDAILLTVEAAIVVFGDGDTEKIERIRSAVLFARPIVDRLLSRLDDYVLDRSQTEALEAARTRMIRLDATVESLIGADAAYKLYEPYFRPSAGVPILVEVSP